MKKPKKTSAVLLKICGLTRTEDVEACFREKIDFLGFNFAETSPRRVSASEAANIWAQARPKQSYGDGPTPQAVGVFVDQSADFIVQTVAVFPELKILQFHGSEDQAFLRHIRKLTKDKTIWKAVKIKTAVDFSSLDELSNLVDAFLFDGPKPGSGTSFNWEWLESAPKKPYGLAGGINPDNIAAAAKLLPYFIDVASGAESAVRIKDAAKIALLRRSLS